MLQMVEKYHKMGWFTDFLDNQEGDLVMMEAAKNACDAPSGRGDRICKLLML